MKLKKYFWDLGLFKYIFKIILKKWTIYVWSIMYFLLIIITLYILPLVDTKFSNVNPLINPLIATLFVFGSGIIGAFLSLEIFRTEIDNGTEMLILSKPISRIESFFIKTFIFIFLIFIVSTFSLLLSLFLLINSDFEYSFYIIIFLSLFVGTFVSSFSFGSISILVSLFLKKISCLLIIFGLLFSFLFISTNITIFGKHPFRYIENSLSTYIADFSKNKTKIDTYYWQKDFDQKPIANPMDQYNEAIRKSNQKLNSYINLGGQLASLFSLSQDPPKNKYINYISSFLNVNYNMETINVFKEGNKGRSFNFTTIDLNNYNNNNFSETYSLEMTNDINDYYRLMSTNSSDYDSYIDNWEITNLFQTKEFINKKWDIYLFDKLWNEFNLNPNKNILNDLKNNTNNYQYESEIFLEYYLKYKNFNKYNKKEIMYSLVELSFSSFKYLISQKDINIFKIFNIFEDTIDTAKIKDVFGDNIENMPIFQELKSSVSNIQLTSNTKLIDIKDNIIQNSFLDKLNNMSKDKYKYRTLFSFLNLSFVKKLDYSNMNLFNITSDYKKFNKLIKYSKYLEFSIKYIDSNAKEFLMVYSIPISITPSKHMEENYYYKIKFVSIYKIEVLLPIWILVSLIFLSSSLYLYINKDFY